MKINNFDVLKRMGETCGDKLQLAPLGNIVNLRKVKAGTEVTIGVAGDVVAALGIEQRFVGGLILADKATFDALKVEMQREATEAAGTEGGAR